MKRLWAIGLTVFAVLYLWTFVSHGAEVKLAWDLPATNTRQ